MLIINLLGLGYSVLADNRLHDGQLWPIPITLDVSDEFAAPINLGDVITLCDQDNSPLATMKITDKWHPNKALEAWSVYGTEDIWH